MTPGLEPRARAALIRCEGVSGAIYVDAVARSNVVGAGAISGGCLGVRFGLQYLRDAIDAAIARLYPTEDREDLGYCPVDLQVVCSEHQNAAPLLVITSPERSADGLRQCVIVSGVLVDEADPRTVRDTIEAREVQA